MKKFIIYVNGNQYEVEVEEVKDGVSASLRTTTVQSKPQEVAKPAPAAASVPQEEKKEIVISQGSEVIEAPMPGTILSINVNEGDAIKEGQVLAILEAMKMENEILAPRDGRVTNVAITKGVSVNTGDKLIVIE